MLKEGDKIPTGIKLLNIYEKEVTLQDFLGNYLVIYFYPKDDTPGCTKEACSFRDYSKDIKELGASIVGISKDSVKSHQKFIDKYDLNFELLSDENLELHKAFGVWVERSMFGKKYFGAQRVTFVIDKKGEIIKVWNKVKPADHGKEIYEFLKGLN